MNDKVNDVRDIITLIENHPFAFIFATLGLGIGIILDNKNKIKEMEQYENKDNEII